MKSFTAKGLLAFLVATFVLWTIAEAASAPGGGGGVTKIPTSFKRDHGVGPFPP